ncbi:hypothetical protein [Polyangium sp. 6x1]|uniref:hypothetical protein n=1 Tax=Polyangium sp. 6x1 TaxID=3042689 RepID=UPI0024823EE7|nr:hypothetical protein [Polyangium sp. 6x1]MDI1450490.1 hypothetical protein [Polyangium sp. 6x1]
MYGHGTRFAAALTLLVSSGSQAEAARDPEVGGDFCFTSLGVRFDAPASIPGGEGPDRIELFLDGKPCMEITPEDRACELRAPPDAVCGVIAPLSIAEGWCHLAEDGSWSANFQVLSSRLLADDVTHALTAYIGTPEGSTVREAPVTVSRYHPQGPNGSSVTCFQGNAAFRSTAPLLGKGPHQG